MHLVYPTTCSMPVCRHNLWLKDNDLGSFPDVYNSHLIIYTKEDTKARKGQ